MIKHTHRSIDGKDEQKVQYTGTYTVWLGAIFTHPSCTVVCRNRRSRDRKSKTGNIILNRKTDMIEEKLESKEMYSFDKIYANSSTLMSFSSILIEFPCVVLADIAKNQTGSRLFGMMRFGISSGITDLTSDCYFNMRKWLSQPNEKVEPTSLVGKSMEIWGYVQGWFIIPYRPIAVLRQAV